MQVACYHSLYSRWIVSNHSWWPGFTVGSIFPTHHWLLVLLEILICSILSLCQTFNSVSKTSSVSAMRPVLHCHCIVAFNPSDPSFKQLADAFLNTPEWLKCEQRGCALPIQLSDTQSKLIKVIDSYPQVTVAVTPSCEWKRVAEMVTRCQWKREAVAESKKHTPLITSLGDEFYIEVIDFHCHKAHLYCNSHLFQFKVDPFWFPSSPRHFMD